jgi:hypothetical protein
MTNFAELADDLQIAADHLRALECLDRQSWTAHQQSQIRRLVKQVKDLTFALIEIHQKTGLRYPSEAEIDAYR